MAQTISMRVGEGGSCEGENRCKLFNAFIRQIMLLEKSAKRKRGDERNIFYRIAFNS